MSGGGSRDSLDREVLTALTGKDPRQMTPKDDGQPWNQAENNQAGTSGNPRLSTESGLFSTPTANIPSTRIGQNREKTLHDQVVDKNIRPRLEGATQGTPGLTTNAPPNDQGNDTVPTNEFEFEGPTLEYDDILDENMRKFFDRMLEDDEFISEDRLSGPFKGTRLRSKEQAGPDQGNQIQADQGSLALGATAFNQAGGSSSSQNVQAKSSSGNQGQERSSSSIVSYETVEVQGAPRFLHRGYMHTKDSGSATTTYFKCSTKKNVCPGRAKLTRNVFELTRKHTCRRPHVLGNVGQIYDFLVRARELLNDYMDETFTPEGHIRDGRGRQAIEGLLQKTRLCQHRLIEATHLPWTGPEHDMIYTTCELRVCLMRMFHHVGQAFKSNKLAWYKINKWDDSFKKWLKGSVKHDPYAPFLIERLKYDASGWFPTLAGSKSLSSGTSSQQQARGFIRGKPASPQPSVSVQELITPPRPVGGPLTGGHLHQRPRSRPSQVGDRSNNSQAGNNSRTSQAENESRASQAGNKSQNSRAPGNNAPSPRPDRSKSSLSKLPSPRRPPTAVSNLTRSANLRPSSAPSQLRGRQGESTQPSSTTRQYRESIQLSAALTKDKTDRLRDLYFTRDKLMAYERERLRKEQEKMEAENIRFKNEHERAYNKLLEERRKLQAEIDQAEMEKLILMKKREEAQKEKDERRRKYIEDMRQRHKEKEQEELRQRMQEDHARLIGATERLQARSRPPQPNQTQESSNPRRSGNQWFSSDLSLASTHPSMGWSDSLADMLNLDPNADSHRRENQGIRPPNQSEHLAPNINLNDQIPTDREMDEALARHEAEERADKAEMDREALLSRIDELQGLVDQERNLGHQREEAYNSLRRQNMQEVPLTGGTYGATGGRASNLQPNGYTAGNPGGDPDGDPDSSENGNPDDNRPRDQGNFGGFGGRRNNDGNRRNRDDGSDPHRRPGRNYDCQNTSSRQVPALNPPEDWYATLPPPWNVVPAPDSKVDDLTKTITSGSFIKFDGSLLSYLPWRSSFITAAHCKNITIPAKQQYLVSSLERSHPVLATLATDVVYAEDGYRMVIRLLEDNFGGPDQATKRYEAQLDQMPMLVPNDLQSLSNWTAKIISIQTACQAANLGLQNAPWVLKHALARAPVRFKMNWGMWRAQLGRESNLQNLLTYLRSCQQVLRAALPNEHTKETS